VAVTVTGNVQLRIEGARQTSGGGEEEEVALSLGVARNALGS